VGYREMPISIAQNSLAGLFVLVRRIDEQNAVFCSRRILRVNPFASQNFIAFGFVPFMSGSLFDKSGQRKYLVGSERRAFVRCAAHRDNLAATFCLTLALTGARISEVLALTYDRVDSVNRVIVFRTLKQRGKIAYRAIPVPLWLLRQLKNERSHTAHRLWPWGRTKAWQLVKSVMREAGIAEFFSQPKALRHAFAIEAGQQGVPLNIVQRWLGHARIETTAIYSAAMGPEERNLARRSWKSLKI
jgi:integrase